MIQYSTVAVVVAFPSSEKNGAQKRARLLYMDLYKVRENCVDIQPYRHCQCECSEPGMYF